MNSKLLFERTLHETSGGYLQKRHSEHLGSSGIPGTRVYPYPGTTQEPVRNSYHHSATHLSAIPHHLSSLYTIGSNSGHSAAVGPQSYREGNYSVDSRHDFSPIDRYRNRNESNDIHHSSGGSHSGSNPSTGATPGHTQPPLVRRRPSLLPHVPQNDYLLNSSGGLSSPYVNRDRYDIYRYSPYENRGKGATLQSSSMAMPSTPTSQHSGPSSIHMVGHGLHLPVGHPHQSSAIVSSQHLSQSHVIQDIQDLNVNKRPRLGFTNDSRPPIHQPLLIDTRDVVEVKKEPAYVPQVEAISPTLPNDDIRQDSPLKSTKDELLQNINKIDREILQTESQISKLRKKHQDLELVTNKPSADNQELQDNSGFESQLSVAQLIYSDNKAKTMRAHSQFDKLGPIIDLPLYNQPSDTVVYDENKRNFVNFKKKLIQFFKKRYKEKELREKYLTDTYDKLMLSWLKKLEKKETNPPKKAKDLKLREYFEKQFPELRKQREDKERFSRVGQRIRSDAELEEIMDGLQEQELEDKKMRSYAVIPPILLDSRHKKHNYINLNGIIEDPMAEYKERQVLNIWTDQEKEIFREKYLLHPKNFGLIATFLERKSVSECVQYYYLSKKSENYKQLLRKQVKKRTRALVKAQQQQQQQAIAAQAQSQQQRLPPAVARQQNLEEITKTTTTTAITTTSTTPTSTASVVNTNTATTTSSVTVPSPVVSANIDLKTDSTVNDNGLKCDNISDNEENNGNNQSTCDIGHQCCLCEATVDNYSKSRAVTLSNLNLYNVSNNQFKPGMRVCLMCHFKNVRRHCPLPSCKTPRRKVKRLKSLPQQWFDMSPDTRQLYSNQLNIPNDVRTACPRCVMRISRTIGLIAPNDQMNHNSESSTRFSFTDIELEQLRAAIKDNGKNWSAVAAQVRTKTENECKDFYLENKISLNLIKVYKEFCVASGKTNKTQDSDSDDYWNDISDGDSEETSSAEEGNDRCNSDTASASSPISKTIDEMESTSKSNVVKTDNTIDCSSSNPNFQEDFTKLQDFKGLSASQTSLKSDYDSSATMSADEGQGNGEAERLSSSPAVSLPPRANSAMPVFPPSNSIYFQHQAVDKHVRPASHDAAFAVDMVNKGSHSASALRASDSNLMNSRQKVPPFLINPNAPSTPHSSNTSNMVSNVSKEEPTCVRDLIYQAIEMSLQSPLKPMRTNPQPMGVNEINKLDVNEAVSPNPYPLPIIKRENIMEMTKTESSRDSPSRLLYKNVDIQRPEGLAVMASYRQHMSPSPGHGPHPYVIVEADDYEVQDLSKKDRRIDPYSPRNYSPSLKEKPLSHRNEYSYGLIPAAHSNQNRGSTPLSAPPNETNVETKDNFNLMKGPTHPSHPDSNRHINPNFVINERMSAQDILRSRASPSNRSINKLSKPGSVPPPPPLINSGKPFSQLSPQMYKEKVVPVSAPSGGSITQGTPGIQPNSYIYGQNRYDGLLRQMPTIVHREGSITLGTPLMGGNPNATIDANRRRSDVPITDQNRSDLLSRNIFDHSSVEQMYRRSPPVTTTTHSYSTGFHQNIYKHNKIPFHKESQLSTNQIMIDFNTSKQMLTRRGSNSSEKDGRSSTPVHNQMESRSSHSDPKNSTQNRVTNSYPNYNQSSSHSPVVSMSSSVYNRESQPQMMSQSDAHLNQWSARHSPMGAQSPNYSRQNVIQHHWNASNSKQSVIQTPKSSSPRDYRTEAVSPVAHPIMRNSVSPQVPITSALYSPSHDAFTTLVNAAAAQQSLAVPNDRRLGSNSVSRLGGDPSIRSNIKDKPSVEGLEKSLMEMHGRPRIVSDAISDSNRFDDKLRNASNETNRSSLPPNEDYVYALEQRRRLEMEQMADLERQRYNRSVNEQNNPLSQPSLRFSREPFSREQFERELRQPTEPMRNTNEHSFRIKSDEIMDQIQDSRLGIPGLRPQVSELDNEASKLFSQSFQKDNQKMNSSRGQFTAANLIDAIITHQINASTESPNGKVNNTPAITTTSNMSDVPQSGADSLFARYHNNEKLVASQYPNREEVVTIADSPDPDPSFPPNERITSVSNPTNSSKGVTLGEHIATIISKNYSNESRTQSSGLIQIDPRGSPTIYSMPEQRPSNSTILEGIAAAAVSNAPTDIRSQSPPHSSWKLRKALQQDKEAKESDERQIIRIVQNVSPKDRPVYPIPNKSSSPALSHYNVEPISPPTHSSPDNSSQLTTTFSPMQTTWSPTAGIHSVVSGRPLYGADSSEVSNIPSKQSPQSVSANQANTNRSNAPPLGLSPLDYVKNRIVEVMRTTSDDTGDDLNKRPNNEINSTQNEKTTKPENEMKISISMEKPSNVESSNKINTNCLKREISKSPAMDAFKIQVPVSISSSDQKSFSSLSNTNVDEMEATDRSPPKKMRKSCEQNNESSDCCEKVETSVPKTTSKATPNESNKSSNNETQISQSSVQEMSKSDERVSIDNSITISSSENDMKSVEKTTSEVSSGDDTTSASKQETKCIYPDSPNSANSPGEMVIDESDNNLTSSLSPNDKTCSEGPPTSSSQSTQQSFISTTDVHKSDSSNAFKTSLICSSSESTSTTSEALNQSHSVSSSVIELNKTPVPVSAESSAQNEKTPNYSNNTNVLSTRSDTTPNSANSVSSTARTTTVSSAASNPDSRESNIASNKASVNTSGVSSSIGCEGVPQTSSQTNSSSSIQSSAISASGAPTSTTNTVSTPQYEPLSDDE